MRIYVAQRAAGSGHEQVHVGGWYHCSAAVVRPSQRVRADRGARDRRTFHTLLGVIGNRIPTRLAVAAERP